MSDDNVVTLKVNTVLPLPAEHILKAAIDGDLEDALVIGWQKDGELWFSSTTSNLPDVLWLLERAKRHLMEEIAPE